MVHVHLSPCSNPFRNPRAMAVPKIPTKADTLVDLNLVILPKVHYFRLSSFPEQEQHNTDQLNAAAVERAVRLDIQTMYRSYIPKMDHRVVIQIDKRYGRFSHECSYMVDAKIKYKLQVLPEDYDWDQPQGAAVFGPQYDGDPGILPMELCDKIDSFCFFPKISFVQGQYDVLDRITDQHQNQLVCVRQFTPIRPKINAIYWKIGRTVHRPVQFDRPAKIKRDGTHVHFTRGYRHRLNGRPAVQRASGEHDYYHRNKFIARVGVDDQNLVEWAMYNDKYSDIYHFKDPITLEAFVEIIRPFMFCSKCNGPKRKRIELEEISDGESYYDDPDDDPFLTDALPSD
jgi:hypothetical protein